MSEGYDVRLGLAAVMAHVQANPGLEFGVGGVSLPLVVSPSLVPEVRVSCLDEEVELLILLRWVESLRAVEQIEVRTYTQEDQSVWLHLEARGQLVSGAPVEVNLSYRGQQVRTLRDAAGDAKRVEVAEFARIIGAEAGVVGS
ncbi:hypothetical protein NLX83_39735 [Allokutzneria sp. A3M-2-11 16]|uniref:hypothetical protein n=1 Tax=Allokutzneria sp. A3M-2-11 16 TaxID=2962043 RepID=UPI0020B7DC54|nr:hypothetical protein [Allokutzneria sp. A3M-2-11 16]MCP3805417.1 hypothetical protein [Allokutzneria sp. A3M-2-11 16]